MKFTLGAVVSCASPLTVLPLFSMLLSRFFQCVAEHSGMSPLAWVCLEHTMHTRTRTHTRGRDVFSNLQEHPLLILSSPFERDIEDVPRAGSWLCWFVLP